MAVEDGEGETAAPWAVAAAGLRAGKGLRAVAIDLFGVGRVDAEWTPDGPMRATVRRRRSSAGRRPAARSADRRPVCVLFPA